MGKFLGRKQNVITQGRKIFRGGLKNFRRQKKPEWVKKFLWRGEKFLGGHKISKGGKKFIQGEKISREAKKR